MKSQRKKLRIFNLAVALLALSSFLPSCVQEDFDLDGNHGSEGYVLPKGKYYVAFNIADTDGFRTRANLGDPHPSGDFVDGDHGEHEIGSGNSFVIFLNADDVVVEVSELSGTHNEHPEDWIEGNYVSRFDVDEDYETPNSCIIILNATRYEDKLKGLVGKNKSELLNLRWEDNDNPMSIGMDGARFTMAKSVYMKE